MLPNNSLLRDRNFLLFLTAILVTKLGDKIYVLAIPWLIYELPQSSLGVGRMFLVQTLPFIFISPIAGVIADRFSRKKILIISAWLQGILISLIPLFHYTDLLQVWMIYILGFLIACSGACYSVINGSIIPQLFSKEVLIKVNSTFQFIDTSSVFFGSMVAGIFISVIGVYNLLIFNAISFIIISLAISLLTMKEKMHIKKGDSNSLEQLKDGGKFILKHPVLGQF
jgi:MFS family permease